MHKQANNYHPAVRISEYSEDSCQPSTVTTRMVLNMKPADLFRAFMFYEDIGKKPPILLRLLLPVPSGTKGEISEVGSIVTCMYDEGYIQKRITRIKPDTLYEFEVTGQTLIIGGDIRLSGGCFRLHDLGNGKTEVLLETHYYYNRNARWHSKFLERLVCQTFHRYIIKSISCRVEGLN